MSTPLVRPKPHIVPASEDQTSTLIFLHGTSTSGPELASSLIRPQPSTDTSSSTSSSTSPSPPQTLSSLLASRLPNTKFIFPTGSLKYTTVLKRDTHAWFDVHDFSDRTKGESASTAGIVESIDYITTLLFTSLRNSGKSMEDEKKALVLAGFSQGAALLGIWLLSGEMDTWIQAGKLRSILLFSGWLPFRKQIWEAVLPLHSVGERRKKAKMVVREILGLPSLAGNENENENDTADMEACWDSLQLFVVHGDADEKVRLEWARQEVILLRLLGLEVGFEVLSGVGHEMVGSAFEG